MRGLLATAFVAFLLTTSGCYSFRIVPVYGNSEEAVPPVTETESETVYALFWGLIEPEIRPDDCMGNGFAVVTAKTNVLYLLASVVTLGIWVPMEVEWRCAGDTGDPDDFE